MTPDQFVASTRLRVRFRGLELVLPKHAGWKDSPLAFSHEYEGFLPSFAHVWVPVSPAGNPGGIYRHSVRIGGIEELEVLGPMDGS